MSGQVHRPQSGVSNRRVETTPEERKEFQRQWKEDREHKEKLKEERFAKIRERRKNSKGPNGRGINIEVTSDS